MASNGIIAHRFANRNYSERGLKGSSTSISGINYYSYSTVFGQWVDEKVCLCYWGSTSNTSYKHMLRQSDFPKDITIFPYDDGGGSGYWNSWHGCDLLGWRGKFDYDARVRLMDYWIGEIYDALHVMVDGKSKDLDKHAEKVIGEYWAYVEKLCSMYKDTSVPKWLKKKRMDMDGTWRKKKVVVKALYKSEREVRVLVDAAFGQGTYKKYYDYCARYRKAEDNKAKMIELCHRLGMSSPYRDYWHEKSHYAHNPYSTAEIRKMSAKERNDLHFANLMEIEWRKNEGERKKKYENNRLNAYRWIVGYEPKYDTTWSGDKRYRKDVFICKNMYTEEVYSIGDEHIYGFYWCETKVEFEYDAFRKSEDKEQWIRNFYAKCKEASENRKALYLLKKYGVLKEKVDRWEDDKYVGVTSDFENIANDEDKRVVSDFIAKQDKHYADEEARMRAAAIERQKREEERRREEEYKRQVKQSQIQECVERGAEGMRDLWRMHLVDVWDAENTAKINGVDHDFFYYGGNVLLRLNLDKTHVESSKGVRVPVAVARLWFKKVKQWHEDEKSFKPIEWNTKGNGTYEVSSYSNDILTAGCHDIAYAEMERMYNEIVSLGL